MIMRTLLSLSLAALLLLLTGCGNADTSSAATEPAETAKIPTTTAYQAAETALNDGKNAAAVAPLLLNNFNAVSDVNTGVLDETASNDYVRLARSLSDKFPADTMAAKPLYRAAEVVRALNKPREAAGIYRMVCDRYPTFSKSAEALFMLAFTYDEDLKEYDAAREIYNDFLVRYPEHTFADDTEMLLKNLGKTSEEMLREMGTDNK